MVRLVRYNPKISNLSSVCFDYIVKPILEFRKIKENPDYHLLLYIILVKKFHTTTSFINSEQFKDIPSNICLYSSERGASDQNGCGLSLNTQWGNILLLDFLFSCSKTSDTNIAIIANFCVFVKNQTTIQRIELHKFLGTYNRWYSTVA